MTTSAELGRKGGQPAMHTPPVVAPQAWEAARKQLLVKEKAQTRARDAPAAERRHARSSDGAGRSLEVGAYSGGGAVTHRGGDLDIPPMGNRSAKVPAVKR